MIKVAFAGWLTMALAMFLFGSHQPDDTWYDKAIISSIVAAGVELLIGLLIVLWVWALS